MALFNSDDDSSLVLFYHCLNLTCQISILQHLSHEFYVITTYRSPKLREQAIQVLRDLLAGHDSDLRYNSPEARSKIASIYLPLLSVVMDNYQLLYKGGDGWEDWATTFERNTSARRRSVVIRGDATDGSLEVEQV